MAFWSSEKLKEKIEGETLIAPYDPKRVEHGAYELSVGPETFLTSDSSGKKQRLDEQDQVVIPPGQLGLLITEEEVKIPLDAISLISIKAGIKFRGLVNVSGFHVDPGFRGRLKFSVYNAGSQNVVLTRHQPAFLIWFCDLDRSTKEPYNGVHLGQVDITAEDVMRLQGEVASPGQLKKEIQELQNSLTNVKFGLTVLFTLFGIILAAALRVIPLSDIFTRVNQAPATLTTPATEKEKISVPNTGATSEPLKGHSAPSQKPSTTDRQGGK